jgi:RNA polymerase sigma factor (sigma-70 family)
VSSTAVLGFGSAERTYHPPVTEEQLEELVAEPGKPLPAPDAPTPRAALWEDMQPLVRRLVRQYGEDAELRQDLPGVIYCRFCALLEAYDPARGIPLRPYLVRQMTAATYTYVRSRWRQERRETSLDASAGALEPSTPEDPSRQWDHELSLEKVLSALPGAIACLPLRQRQVVVWRYYEARSFEEIAELLEIRPATARSILRHGLNNLRRRFAEAASQF